MFAWTRRGVLPVAGGLADQAPRFVQAMEIVDDALAELEVQARSGK